MCRHFDQISGAVSQRAGVRGDAAGLRGNNRREKEHGHQYE